MPRAGAISNCLILTLVIACAGGCDALGPQSIRASRGGYNAAVQQTSKEQLLLNVVRLRYADPPLFFDITSVASSMSASGSIGTNSSFSWPSAGSFSYSPGASFAFSETPTVTYVPLQGDNLVKQMMSPVSLEVIASLYRAGCDVRTLLALTVDRLGAEISNTSLTGGNGKFAKVLAEFRALQELDALDIAVRKSDTVDHRPGGQPLGPDVLTFIIDPNAAPENRRQDVLESQARLRKLLPATSASTRPATTHPAADEPADDGSIQQFTFHIRRGARGSEPASVDTPALRTRSVLGAMSYVADGVDIPAADQPAAERVIPPSLHEALLSIHSADSPPSDAYVAVPYRGQWFYIADNDPRAKTSFTLLFEVMGAQASGLQNTGLLLTLPVARQ